MTDVRDESSGSRELVEELAGRLCNWDRWDRHDGVGALNLITPAKRLEGSAAVRADVPNYTSITPVLQVSEIVA